LEKIQNLPAKNGRAPENTVGRRREVWVWGRRVGEVTHITTNIVESAPPPSPSPPKKIFCLTVSLQD